MASVDLKNDITVLNAFDVQTIASDTTTVGNEVNSQFFESVTFLMKTGGLTDGTYTPLVEHSDVSGSGYTTVGADFLLGTTAGAALSVADTASVIGYVGKKQYVRLSLVSTSVTTGATLTATVVLESARHNPTV